MRRFYCASLEADNFFVMRLYFWQFARFAFLCGVVGAP